MQWHKSIKRKHPVLHDDKLSPLCAYQHNTGMKSYEQVRWGAASILSEQYLMGLSLFADLLDVSQTLPAC